MSAPSVLILYASQDAFLAEKIYNALTKKYVDNAFSIKRYWDPFAFQKLTRQQGQSEALKEARHIIMLFSHAYIGEYARQLEWRETLQRDPDCSRGIIIPICIEQCDFSHILNVTTCLKLFDLQDGEMTDEMSKRLYEVFKEAQVRWERYQNPAPPVPPTPEVAKPPPYFEKPHFPDKWFFNAPLRNRFFTGREQLFTRIEQAYRRAQHAQRGSPYTIVLSGLRGIGKTQIALEYAHRYFNDELYQYVLWVGVGLGSHEQLDDMIKPLIKELHQKGLIKNNQQDARALKDWLQEHQKWLLVFDELDDVLHIPDYLPSRGDGHVLVTACTKIVSPVCERIDVDKMGHDDAILFLLGRTIGKPYKTLDKVPPEEREQAGAIVQAMHHFPLAIDQVGAFLDSKKRSLKSYVESYLGNHNVPLITLLKERGGPDRYHPSTVVESWLQYFHQLKSTHPMAADLLVFCAFFNPSGTYEKIFTDGHNKLGPYLSGITDDFSSETSLDGLIENLRKYSFIERKNEILSVHPFLPMILADRMEQEKQLSLAEKAVLAVHQTCFRYEDGALKSEDITQLWLSQMEACQRLIDQWQLQNRLPEQVQQLMDLKIKWEQMLKAR